MILERWDYVKLYAPAFAYLGVILLVSLVGAIYGCGYRAGMRNLLDASAKAVSECAR